MKTFDFDILCCRFFNNAYYAKVGGITRAELNRLEIKFLFGIDFQLYVNISTFKRYCLELMGEDSEYDVQKERPAPAIRGSCKIMENQSKNNDDSNYPTIEIPIK